MKLKHNILVLSFLSILGATAYDFESKEMQREKAISFFIMEMAEDYNSYLSHRFQKIDVEFLESQMPIYERFAIVQDTTQRRLQIIDQLNLNLSQELVEFRKTDYKIDEVDELLVFNAGLDRLLYENQVALTPDCLNQETEALRQLNDFLSLYNLSVLSLDLSGEHKSYYYHKFKLAGEMREAIFELDHKTEAILSYKEIS